MRINQDRPNVDTESIHDDSNKRSQETKEGYDDGGLELTYQKVSNFNA